jgi:hypothetical protein
MRNKGTTVLTLVNSSVREGTSKGELEEERGRVKKSENRAGTNGK